MNKEMKGAILIALSTLGSGSMAIFAKLAYEAGLNVLTVLLGRFVLAAILLWIVSAVLKANLKIGMKKILTFLGIGIFGYGVMAFLFFTSLKYLTAPVASLLLYTYPAIVFVLSLIARLEKFHKLKLVSLLLSLSGVLLVVGGNTGVINPRGIAFVLTAAILYSFYILISKHVMDGTSPLAATTYISIGAVIFNLVWALSSGGVIWHVPAIGWFGIAGTALFSTVLTLIFFLEGIKYLGPSAAAIISTTEPVITTALASLVLGEHLTPKQLIGGMVIITGVLALQLAGKKKTPETA